MNYVQNIQNILLCRMHKRNFAGLGASIYSSKIVNATIKFHTIIYVIYIYVLSLVDIRGQVLNKNNFGYIRRTADDEFRNEFGVCEQLMNFGSPACSAIESLLIFCWLVQVPLLGLPSSCELEAKMYS